MSSSQPRRSPWEAFYSFTLPRDAALRRFRMKGENFRVHFELKPVEEACERGIEEGHLATLARVYRDGAVNLNVGNVRPDETILPELEILPMVDPAR